MLERSVIIPAFNEAQRLPSLLRALAKSVDPATTEIIVVDDGSSDATASVAEAEGTWSPHLTVIRMPRNRGKGAAVRTGVSQSTTPIVIFLDADNATDLAALPKMEEALSAAHAAFGSRNAPGAQVHGSPPLRGFMGRTFSRIARAVLGTAVSDSQCGAKAFRGDLARELFGRSTLDGFAFDIEILRMLEQHDLTVVEIPVVWTHQTGSKIGLLDPVIMLKDTLRVRLTLRPGDLSSELMSLEPT